MKILLVAMNSIHFVRWTNQLKDSGHEVYWFDILDGGRAARLPWVNQITGWKQKYPNFKGRYFFKKRLPWLYKISSPIFERNTEKEFEKVVKQVKPDIVHGIVLYISCFPILNVMKKHKSIPWVYSSWGSDLFYYKNQPKFKNQILKTLPSIDYLITDCKRDVVIAKNLGFRGEVLGTFPGGGGFEYEKTDKYIKPVNERKTILIKGYQGRSGKAIEVLKALGQIFDKLNKYSIIVFGADEEVVEYVIKNKLEVVVLPRVKFLPQYEILKLMGEALLYIGNSNSDGMPNTLLEAIAQGAFPIQSNPGGVTEEVIVHKKNGLLIDNCDNINQIKNTILYILETPELIDSAFVINQNEVKPKFERELIKKAVLKAYNSINNIT